MQGRYVLKGFQVDLVDRGRVATAGIVDQAGDVEASRGLGAGQRGRLGIGEVAGDVVQPRVRARGRAALQRDYGLSGGEQALDDGNADAGARPGDDDGGFGHGRFSS